MSLKELLNLLLLEITNVAELNSIFLLLEHSFLNCELFIYNFWSFLFFH